MLKQLVAVLFCFAGIMLSTLFWMQFPFMQEWLQARSMAPNDFLWGVAGWISIGALSCLFLARHIACWGMKVDILPLETEDVAVDSAHELFKKLARDQGLRCPQFGVYERPEVNAMSVGWSLQHGVVAVSRGALEQLTPDELRFLLQRQLQFLASGDARALSLMQGMIYSLSLYVARMLALLLGTSLRATEEEETSSHFIELLVTAGLILLLAAPSALLFWAFNRHSARAADRSLLAHQEGRAYQAFMQRVSSLKEPPRELFSDSFKWRVASYPKLLAFATPIPTLSQRLHSLAK